MERSWYKVVLHAIVWYHVLESAGHPLTRRSCTGHIPKWLLADVSTKKLFAQFFIVGSKSIGFNESSSSMCVYV